MKIKMGVAVLLAGMAALNVNGVFAADKFTEEKLTELEYKNGQSSENMRLLTKDESLVRFPVLAYAEAFGAEIQSQTDQRIKEEAPGLLDGVGQAALATASPVMIAPVEALGGFNPVLTAVTVTAIGLNILKIASHKNVSADVRRDEIEKMQHPSFYLVKTDQETDGDESLQSVYIKMNALVSHLPFDCQSAVNRLGESAAGFGKPNHTYRRTYICNYRDSDYGFFDSAHRGVRYATSFRTEGVSVFDEKGQMKFPGSASIISFHALDKMKYAKMLGIPEGDDSQKAHLGKIAYEKAKDVIPPDWTAVYTAPNSKGEWAVFVARNGVTIEFPMPKS